MRKMIGQMRKMALSSDASISHTIVEVLMSGGGPERALVCKG